MRVVSVSLILAASLVAGNPGLAKDPPDNPQAQRVGELHRALAAVAATAQPLNPKIDRDQGDDHANPGAILRVCSKDTPAAQRAAICPVGVSPD